MHIGLNGPWTGLSVQIDISEAMRYLGLRSQKTAPTPEILAISRQMSELAMDLVRPAGIGFAYPVSSSRGGLVIGDTLEISGPRTCRRLGEITWAYLFAVTIGPQLEQKVADFFEQGEYTQGTIMDSMGSVAVESLAEAVNRTVQQKVVELGMVAGDRVSPGYNDWPLEAQFGLFPLTGGDEIGIRMNQSGLLIPRKSITALIGIGSECLAELAEGGCEHCTLDNCQFRR